MSFETIQDYEFSLAAGASIELPGGNLFMIYNLTGPDKLAATFRSGSGQQSAKANVRANFTWGNGKGAEGGGLLFSSVVIKNESATPATVVLYMAHQKVDANVFSGSLNVASLPAGESAGNPLYVARGLSAQADIEPVLFVKYWDDIAANNYQAACIRQDSGFTGSEIRIREILFSNLGAGMATVGKGVSAASVAGEASLTATGYNPDGYIESDTTPTSGGSSSSAFHASNANIVGVMSQNSGPFRFKHEIVLGASDFLYIGIKGISSSGARDCSVTVIGEALL